MRLICHFFVKKIVYLTKNNVFCTANQFCNLGIPLCPNAQIRCSLYVETWEFTLTILLFNLNLEKHEKQYIKDVLAAQSSYDACRVCGR